VALPDEDEATPAFTAPAAAPVPTATAAAVGTTSAPLASPPQNFVSEQVIWTCLKAVTLIFVLIALVLVAESV
jgi:hypothetical protein